MSKASTSRPATGFFLVLEGPEGSGKTTLSRALGERFAELRIPVITTREPGGGRLGAELRRLLLDHDSLTLTDRAEALLHAAARADHIAEVIKPALDRKALVISDRYVDSSLAYQGGGRGLPLAQVQCIQQFATEGLAPDLRVLLDIPIELGLTRRQSDASSVNRLDREEIAFHQRVLATYHELVQRDPAGWMVIDGQQPTEQLVHLVEQEVFRRWSPGGDQPDQAIGRKNMRS